MPLSLQPCISSVTSDHPIEAEVRRLVNLCCKIARTYLQRKSNSGKFDPAFFGISLEDLALDCIADLFRRDEHGQYREFQNYFRGDNISCLDEVSLLGALRRLVFSKVSHEIFRLYKQHDPSLSKIIRRIKESAKSTKDILVVHRGKEQWIVAENEELKDSVLPLMPQEFLESAISERCPHGFALTAIMQAIPDILAEQDLYRKEYPLVGLALVLRNISSSRDFTEESHSVQPSLSESELTAYIERSVYEVKEAMVQKYVGKNKIEPMTYDLYFLAIRDILIAEYVQNDGEENSFYEILSGLRSQTTKQEYAEKHRIYLEYLAKLTRNQFISVVRKEYVE
jgi:hypothetical protein